MSCLTLTNQCFQNIVSPQNWLDNRLHFVQNFLQNRAPMTFLLEQVDVIALQHTLLRCTAHMIYAMKLVQVLVSRDQSVRDRNQTGLLLVRNYRIAVSLQFNLTFHCSCAISFIEERYKWLSIIQIYYNRVFRNSVLFMDIRFNILLHLQN